MGSSSHEDGFPVDGPSPVGRQLRVVVADDHALSRRDLVRAFEATRRLTVVGEASDGREAVALVSRLRPDVAVLDVRMPQLDGLQATRNIRVHTRTAVVLISAYDNRQYREAARQIGATAFVPKSASEAELVATVIGAAGG